MAEAWLWELADCDTRLSRAEGAGALATWLLGPHLDLGQWSRPQINPPSSQAG